MQFSETVNSEFVAVGEDFTICIYNEGLLKCIERLSLNNTKENRHTNIAKIREVSSREFMTHFYHVQNIINSDIASLS
jgi:hypothetical protein